MYSILNINEVHQQQFGDCAKGVSSVKMILVRHVVRVVRGKKSNTPKA